MSHIGRNDPCPCGSGKKFKKCCIGKDDAVMGAHAHEAPSDDDGACEPYEGESSDGRGWREYESDMIEEPAQEPEVQNEFPLFPDPPEEDLPVLPPDQESLVDEWWKGAKPFFKERNAEAMLRHLTSFWDLHPGLIPYLELEQEYLFELGADLGRHKEWPRFTELLLRLREQHPVAYLRSFGYFDHDLIIEALAQGRIGDVPRFYDIFHRYPGFDVDNSNQIARLLAWAGTEAALLDFTKPIRKTPDGPGVSLDVDWLLFGLRIPHLDAGADPDEATNSVTEAVQQISIANLSGVNLALLRQGFDRARQAPSLPDYDTYRSRAEVTAFCNDVTWNFTGFLRRAKGLPWTRAFFLADRLRQYWERRAEESRPRKPFCLDVRNLEAFLFRTCQTFFHNDGVLTASGIEAMGHFADYLLACGALGKQEQLDLQDGCRTLYRKALASYDSTDPVPRLRPELLLDQAEGQA